MCHCEGAKRPSQSQNNGITTQTSFARNDNGFTLAEVLITLAIIGVVAALTIPTVVKSYKERVTITKVKETYSFLSQAYKFAELENGNPSDWDLGSGMYDENAHINLANYLKPYLKLSADCIGKDKDYINENCFAAGNVSTNSYAYTRLNNGVTLVFRVWSPQCSFINSGKPRDCGEIDVYLSPFDKNSKSGQEVFDFFVTTEGIIPYGMPDSKLTFEKACNLNEDRPYPNFTGGNMYACTGWVIQNGNMDYLKCPGELSWDGKHKCSD